MQNRKTVDETPECEMRIEAMLPALLETCRQLKATRELVKACLIEEFCVDEKFADKMLKDYQLQEKENTMS